MLFCFVDHVKKLRHTIVLFLLRIIQNSSASSFVIPVISTNFILDVRPRRMAIDDFGASRTLARNLMSASLAFPSIGGAATAMQISRSSTETIFSRLAPGFSLTPIMPPLVFTYISIDEMLGCGKTSAMVSSSLMVSMVALSSSPLWPFKSSLIMARSSICVLSMERKRARKLSR